MAEYRLTPRAQDDLRQIWRTIATDSPKAADAMLLALFDKFELAARMPQMGIAKPQIAPDVRILIASRYLVLYEPAEYGVLIVTIVHGMRDPQSWLD